MRLTNVKRDIPDTAGFGFRRFKSADVVNDGQAVNLWP